MTLRTAPLGDLVEINPRLPSDTPHDELASFVPMASLDAETACIRVDEIRQVGEMAAGFSYFQDGDVLVAKITPCFQNGKIAQARISTRHAFGSTEFHVLRPIHDRLNARFLLHFLRQNWVLSEGERKMTGSAGQRRVPKHFLEALEIPLPTIPEQRRIAAILDQAEALRAKRRAALPKLDTLAQGIFIEMFGDSGSNPKGWAQEQLGKFITDGPQNGLYKPAELYGEGTPILRIDGFYAGEVTGMASLKRVRISPAEMETYGLRPNDIVINRVNSPEYLGKCALIPELPEPTVFESNMMRFSVDSKHLRPRYLTWALQSPRIKGQIQTRAKHAINQSSINQKDVQGFSILLPPIDLQQTFEARMLRMRSLMETHQANLTHMDALFSSLQHRAFRGEL